MRHEDYQRIRDAVDCEKICGMVGIKVKHGFAKCPFHKDHNDSLRIYDGDQGFYCFGCHKGGDVITFVAELKGLERKEAAQMLSHMFATPSASAEAAKELRLKQEKAHEFRSLCSKAGSALSDLYRLYRKDLSLYAPTRDTADGEWDERFVTACYALPELEDAINEYEEVMTG